MGLSIKDPEADALARALAGLTGETVSEAVMQALRERLSRVERMRAEDDAMVRIRGISARFKAHLRAPLPDDDVIYDSSGSPRQD